MCRANPPREDNLRKYKKSPLDAAQELIGYFRWESKGLAQGSPIPMEVLAPILVALRTFLDGEAETLDIAFGGNTRSKRRRMNREKERRLIRFLAQDDFVLDILDPKGKGRTLLKGESPKGIRLERTANILDMKAGNVTDIYDGDR